MGICNGKPSPPQNESGSSSPSSKEKEEGKGVKNGDVEKGEKEREKEMEKEAVVEEKGGSRPWASPFFPFYTPSPAHSLFSKKSPLNGRVSASATPGRFFKPFLPPSPAKHIRALLARRQGLVKSNEAAILDGEGGRGLAVALDKNFGFSKGFESKYELGEEVGRGHFGYTCCARSRKGELKGEIVAVKIIPKAKIIHWRRGHKNECHLPQVDRQDKLQESNSHLPWLQPEKSWFLDNTFKNEQMSRTNPVATRFGGVSSDSKISNYVAGDNDIKDIRSFLDSSRMDSTRGSFVDSSSSCSTFPGLSHDIAYEGQEKAAIANLGTNSQCPSNHKNLGAEFDASYPETPSKHSDHNGTLGTNSTHEHSSVNALDGTKEPNLRDCSAMGPDKSGFGPTRKGADDWLLKARRLRSLSVSFADRAFYGGRRHSVIEDSSSKVNNASTMAPKFSKSAGFVPNSKSDLRTSVKSIVHQLKPSLTSMNFPYELFAKLYNSDKVDMDPFGLLNCGNSCFANAVLQCLVFTRPLSAYLLEGFHRAKCSRKGWCFTCEFENVILKGKQGQSPLSPVGILSHIDRIGSHLALGREEDAHEFLRYAIDAMQYTSVEETGDVADKFCEDANLIQLTFGGYLRSEINCMKCKAKSVQLERMMDLTVEIEGDIRTLEQALKQFTTTEVLNGENSYRCDRCKSFERAKKKLSVVEAPNILTIALKRFQLGKFGKLNKSVRFPVHLDLAPYMSRVDPCPLYNLYAVVVHVDVMNAAFSGHYICYVESKKGKWYMINDREVRPVELQRVLKENAYLLFYARKSPHAPSLIKNERHQVPLNTSGWFKKPTNFEHTHRKLSSMAHQNHDHLSRATVPLDFAGGRLYFPRTDSFSDSLSLSCSEEGSWTTESTRNSTSADELSDYLFGGAQQLTDECDYFSHSPSLSGHYRGNHSFKHILYSDRTFATGMLKENYRDDESSPYGGRSSVLMRSSTVNERRHQTLY